MDEENVTGGRTARLPLGVSSFPVVASQYQYIDKTMLLKDIIDSPGQVWLFTRPRRFGKTLALSMLQCFFELPQCGEDCSGLFHSLDIWKCGQKYREEQGAYPVAALSFKDLDEEDWSSELESIHNLIAKEFGRHPELKDSPRCREADRDQYSLIVNGSPSEVKLKSSLDLLVRMLAMHWGKKVVVLIDEYDTPVRRGCECGYCSSAVHFLQGLLSSALKDSGNVMYGVLTGIMQAARGSAFTGLNSIHVNTVFSRELNWAFGYTEEEVKSIMRSSGAGSDAAYEELHSWYGGWRFGGREIFNPWSVNSCFRSGCTAEPYWASTSSNDIIVKAAAGADPDMPGILMSLMQGRGVEACIVPETTYADLARGGDSMLSVLLTAGYLTAETASDTEFGSMLCTAGIPNRDVLSAYGRALYGTGLLHR